MTGDPWAVQRALVRAALRNQGRAHIMAARDLGISEKHLSQMLTGRADGSLRLWVALADLLGMEWQLVPRGEQGPARRDTNQDLVARWLSETPERTP